MYEDKISIKKFGSSPTEVSWEEFWTITHIIFGHVNAGGKTWELHFGEEEADEPENVSTEDTGRSGQEAEPEPKKPEVAAKISEEPEEGEMGQEGNGGNITESDAEFSTGEETEKLGQEESGEDEKLIIVEAVEQKTSGETEPDADEEEKLSDSEIGEAGIVEISEIAPAQKPANTDKQRADGESKPEVIKGEIVTKKQENVRLIDANQLIETIKKNLKKMPEAEIMIQIIEVAPTAEIPTICPNCGMKLKGASEDAD